MGRGGRGERLIGRECSLRVTVDALRLGTSSAEEGFNMRWIISAVALLLFVEVAVAQPVTEDPELKWLAEQLDMAPEDLLTEWMEFTPEVERRLAANPAVRAQLEAKEKEQNLERGISGLKEYYANRTAAGLPMDPALVKVFSQMIRDAGGDPDAVIAGLSGQDTRRVELPSRPTPTPAPKVKVTPSPVRTLRPPQGTQLIEGHPVGGRTTARLSRANATNTDTGGLPYGDTVPLDWYDCYLLDVEAPADLNPVGVLKLNQPGRYEWVSGTSRVQGSWRLKANDDGEYHKIQMTGGIEGRSSDNESYVDTDEFGAGFEAYDRRLERKIYCFQQGPRADQARLMLSRSMIQPGVMRGHIATGEPAQIKFSDGTYQVDDVTGRIETMTKLSTYGSNPWRTKHYFKGGVLDKTVGVYEEDNSGNRALEISLTIRKTSTFMVSEETKLVATLSGRGQARPEAMFGLGKAPPGRGGGISGIYRTRDLYSSSFDLVTRHFFANGYFSDDVPVDGIDIDCTRLKPNGEPFCLRYEKKGNRIRLEDSPGVWWDDGWVSFARVGDGFEIDGEIHEATLDLSGHTWDALYVNQGGHTTGGPLSSSSTAMVWESGFQFTADGRFRSNNLSSVSTTVNSDFSIDAPTIASNNSSDNDSATGTYAFVGNWLELSYNDGRKKRLFASVTSKDSLDKRRPPKYIHIDGKIYWIPDD